MTQSATCPRTSQFLTPPRPSSHLRVRTHTRTHTCPHTPSPQLRPGGGLRPGEPGTESAKWVVPGTAAAEPPDRRANSSRKPESLKMQRPRRLPFRREASGPFTATSGWGELPSLKRLPASPGAWALQVRRRALKTPGRRTRGGGAPWPPRPGAAPPPASCRHRPPRAPGSRSRPSGSQALTAEPRRTRRGRGCSPAVPSFLEPQPPPRAPRQQPKRRSGFRRDSSTDPALGFSNFGVTIIRKFPRKPTGGGMRWWRSLVSLAFGGLEEAPSRKPGCAMGQAGRRSALSWEPRRELGWKRKAAQQQQQRTWGRLGGLLTSMKRNQSAGNLRDTEWPKTQ
ncbi:uncharacterized protein DKFZp434B061-like [Ovis canadensis]|uniref:uncharacterized protein DKFZp434B061-like n=1 Tax=Ovis canadensis TaxID=37174 RepID=UPI0037506C94